MKHEIEQKFELGEIAIHNNKQCRIHAFKYEVRPMGVFKVYECSYTNSDKHKTFNTVETLLIKKK